ncbi:MAG: hypothetical protein HPY50_22130 [Firmicutes bacterium]|nr:hypothetical protein [Bacillota bacterium]
MKHRAEEPLCDYQLIKIYREAIDVVTDAEELPTVIHWRGRSFDVTGCTVINDTASNILSSYFWPTRYHCVTAQGMVCDIVKQDTWILEKTWAIADAS